MRKFALALFAVAAVLASLAFSHQAASAQAKIECLILTIPHGPTTINKKIMPPAGPAGDIWIGDGMVDIMFVCRD